jgi:putative copper resistance protein D
VKSIMDQVTPLTAHSAFTSWRADPVGIAAAVLLAAAYLFVVRQVRAQGGEWLRRRTFVFLLAGCGSLLLVTCSFLGPYASQLRWVAVIQSGLLLLLVPPLIGAGAPVALWQRWRPSDEARPPSRLFRTLQVPGLGPLVIIATTSALVFTPWLSWSVSGPLPRALTLAGLLLAGLVLALPVTDEGAQTTSLAYAAMLGLGLIEFLLDALPGLILRLNTHVSAAGHWTALNRSWGPTPLADQHLAGDWLWFLAEAGDLPYLIILVAAWIRSDTREAARQDAELDLIETDENGMMRPWWQN